MGKLFDIQNIKSRAFSIVEVVVVIGVIGILALVTVVSYGAWQKSAIETQIKNDLSTAAAAMEDYRNFHNVYPTSLSDTGFKPGPGNTLTSTVNADGSSFTISSNNNSKIGGYYTITNNTEPVFVAYVLVCPSGFVKVPGSATYNTSDFCVMKYEAKNINGAAVSQAAGSPWASISQDGAKTASSAACSGCHLMTEAEWMTLAQNVLSVPSNWSSGTVGTGAIYIGDSDNDVGQTAGHPADLNDSLGYASTGNISPSNQRRTLTLTNGEVIWDLSGNVREWTSGTTQGGQPGRPGNDWYFYHDWKGSITSLGTLAVNPSPAGTGIAGSSNWTSANGIGSAWVNSNDINLVGFARGGSWDGYSAEAGILYFDSSHHPSYTNINLGFRVAK